MKDCVFCGQPLERPISLNFIFSFQATKIPLACSKCLDEFQAIDAKTTCPGCFRPQEEAALCADCKKWRQYVPTIEPKHTALFAYNEAARDYMKQFKFQGDVKLADLFAEKIHKALQPYTKTHLITLIPTSAASYQMRGFNAVDLLLQYANIAHHPLLEHIRETELQSSKTRSERLKSVQPFALISPKDLEGLEKPVLVVDDVYTTGRTIFHARELLEKSVDTASFSLFR